MPLIEAPINRLPVNIHAIKKLVKLLVTHHVIVFAIVLIFRSVDIIIFSTHILINLLFIYS